MAGLVPRADAAFENPHVDARLAQQPPGSRGGDAPRVVVGDDDVSVADAPATRRILQLRRRRKRMPSVGWFAVRRELRVERHVHRTGDVPREIVGVSVRPIEPPAHVDHAYRRP